MGFNAVKAVYQRHRQHISHSLTPYCTVQCSAIGKPERPSGGGGGGGHLVTEFAPKLKTHCDGCSSVGGIVMINVHTILCIVSSVQLQGYKIGLYYGVLVEAFCPSELVACNTIA